MSNWKPYLNGCFSGPAPVDTRCPGALLPHSLGLLQTKLARPAPNVAARHPLIQGLSTEIRFRPGIQ